MVHVMLETDADIDWWSSLPDNVKEDFETALRESERGEVVPHEEI